MKATMTKRDVFTASLYTTWRLFQASIVIPASIVGAALLVMTVAGDSPVESTIASIYHWAETSIRPAPAGTVLVSKCANQAAQHTKGIHPPVICQSPSVRAVQVNDAVVEASSWIRQVYLIAVLVSAAFLVLLLPGRKFFGLETPAAT